MARQSRKGKVVRKRAGPTAIPAGAAAQEVPSRWNQDWLGGLILLLAVFLVYQPIWYAGFIWDDDWHLTANPCIVGPLGLKEIWTTSAGQFFPLVLTTFWVEHALWGLNPLPYHLVNVLMHGASAVVLWRVLRSLAVPGAWLGAALWALHPLQLESVAWISEMKNTQSCLFYLLAILFFIKYLKAQTREPSGKKWAYGLTLLFSALAMASKSPTAVLPAILGLCAWWVEGRWPWRHLSSLGPILLMSVASGALTLWPQPSGTVALIPDSAGAGSWPERVARAGHVIWFYLEKLICPYPLMAVYPRWHTDAGQWTSYLPLLAAMVILFILWLKRLSWARSYFFAFSSFLVVLLPFLGLIDQSFWRFSFVEDHLQYLAGMGPLALAGAGLVRLADSIISGRSWLQSSLCAGLLLILGLTSWQHCWVYENEETLWTDTLAKNPNCWVGYNDLGFALGHRGKADEAMVLFQKALELNPRYAAAHNNLGYELLQRGQVDEAMTQFQTALELNPIYADAYSNLGNALAQKGREDDAMVQYKKALEINSNDAEAHYNFGLALDQAGRLDEAIAHYQKALEINPANAQAHNNLGFDLVQEGQANEAMAQFQAALAIDPNNAQAHNNLGLLLSQEGRLDEAIVQLKEALRLNPDDSGTQRNLAKMEAAAQERARQKN